jgi:hypothetical protein
VATPNTLRTLLLTWDDSAGPHRRRRLVQPHAGPSRMVTLCSGIAFPSTHDHGALCPRQTHSAPCNHTIRWSGKESEQLFEEYTMAGADAARASTGRPGDAPSRRSRAVAATSSWGPALAGRAPAHPQGRTGVPAGPFRAAIALAPRAGGGSSGTGHPRHAHAPTGGHGPRRPGGYPQARLP